MSTHAKPEELTFRSGVFLHAADKMLPFGRILFLLDLLRSRTDRYRYGEELKRIADRRGDDTFQDLEIRIVRTLETQLPDGYGIYNQDGDLMVSEVR